MLYTNLKMNTYLLHRKNKLTQPLNLDVLCEIRKQPSKVKEF